MSKHFSSTLLILSCVVAACSPIATSTPIEPTTAVPTASPVGPALTGEPPTLEPTETTPTALPPTATRAAPANTISLLTANSAVTLTVINMQDLTTGWGIGQAVDDPNDHVLRTSDGGTTWQEVTPPQPYDPAESQGLQATAWFADADMAWVIYAERNLALLNAEPIVWRTTDGGQTWEASTPLVAQEAESFWPSAFSFADAQNGWLMVHAGAGMNHDYVFVYRTEDGGATWAEVVNPFAENLPMSCYKNGMLFADAQTGWITGDCGGVSPEVYFYTTTDGGQTWATVPLPNPTADPAFFENSACRAQDLQMPAPENLRVLMVCMAFDETGTYTSWLFSSEDNGATWHFSEMPMGAGTLMFLTPEAGWFLGTTSSDASQAQYELFQTADSGESWQAVKQLAWTSHLDWLDANTAFGIAHSWLDTGEEVLAVVKTTNGGQTWQEITPVITP